MNTTEKIVTPQEPKFKLFSFPINKKFRVIMNGVCFYTTKKKILYGVGDLTDCNNALQVMLCAYEYEKSLNKAVTGYAANNRGFSIQLNESDIK